MPEGISCIHATAADLDRLRAWMQAFYVEEGLAYSAPCAAALEVLLQEPGIGAVGILRAGEEAAGYFVVTWGFSLERGGRVGLLDELYVAPAYRGRGVGKAGVESAVGMARAAGCGAVMLELDVRNERARGLYVGAGFVPQGRDVLSRRV